MRHFFELVSWKASFSVTDGDKCISQITSESTNYVLNMQKSLLREKMVLIFVLFKKLSPLNSLDYVINLSPTKQNPEGTPPPSPVSFPSYVTIQAIPFVQ